ncbi:MAG: hypothetical protein ACE5G0_10720 [Rhodothermales bacterium]
MLRGYVLPVLAVLLTAGCFALTPPHDGAAPPIAPDSSRVDTISGIGTITYQDLEGGFYGLVAEDGRQYYPLNLAEDFQQDSLHVHFRTRRRTDVVSIIMWGEIIEILEMRPVGSEK